jgi:predicted O-methyltransferase YrrM
MYYQIKSYLKFLLKSTNQHGVHSPFVYNLVTKCFYAKTANEKLLLSKKYRALLYQDNTKISITDFGKGSRVFKTNERKVAKIAKIAGINKGKSRLLIRIVEYLKPKTILEIGTSLGIGTASLKIGDQTASITTLEGCPKTLEVAKNQLNLFDFSDIQFIEGDFKKTLSTAFKNITFDLVYFDGNHQKKPTINYFEQCIKHASNESVFIFDDIHWSKEMTEAWEYIKNHKKVSVSIDIYSWGIVFFRKEQLKEHFVIRV